MLKEREKEYLDRMAEESDQFEDKLTEWELNFIEDIMDRLERFGLGTMLSPRQWEIISRIGEKLGL